MKGYWLNPGVDPLPPPASDKMLDREALDAAGGVCLLAGHRVLDIGPCYGTDAQDWGPIARCYVVVDLDDGVLAWVGKHAPQVRRVVGDARCLPFGDRIFDAVLDFGTLDNTGDPTASYREACRVLRPGGVLVSSYGNANVLGPGDGVGEIYSHPEALAGLLVACQLTIIARGQEDQPRAYVAGRKEQGK